MSDDAAEPPRARVDRRRPGPIEHRTRPRRRPGAHCTGPARRCSGGRTGAPPGAAGCRTSRARRGPSSTRRTGCSRSRGWRARADALPPPAIADARTARAPARRVRQPTSRRRGCTATCGPATGSSTSTGRSWLIDPAAHGGHREFDLAMMRLFGGFGGRVLRRVRRGVPARRRAGRNACALHQIAPLVVHAIKFGGGYVAAATAAIAQYN